MASSKFQINDGVVKDDLTCIKCKSVPKDACLVPCGCRLCRICINDLMASGVEFCPGSSEECGGSPLLQSVTDYRANRNISKLPIICPNNGCVHACQLDNMEEHLRVCPRKNVECPFRELGCTQERLAAEEMSVHLQRESLSHNEILIGMINNGNNEMESSKKEIDMLKKTNEINKREFEELKIRDESNKREIDILKKTNADYKNEIENNKKNIEKLKVDLALKDEQIKSIMEHINSIKKENKEWTDRMNTSLVDTKREINETRRSSNAELTKYVDKGLTAIKKDIESINQATQSIKTDIDSIKSQVPTNDSLTQTVLGILVSALEKQNVHGQDGDKNVPEITITPQSNVKYVGNWIPLGLKGSQHVGLPKRGQPGGNMKPTVRRNLFPDHFADDDDSS